MTEPETIVNSWRIYRDPDYFNQWRVSKVDNYSTAHSAFFERYEDAERFARENEEAFGFAQNQREIF